MGVDAQMMFTMKAAPTRERLDELQFHLMNRFGKNMFMTSSHYDEDAEKWLEDAKPFPFLRPIGTYTQDGDDIALENMVEIKLFCRYYGDGYERGPGLELTGMILFLLMQPDIEFVFYGGDSSGIIADPYTREDALESLDLYLLKGNLPYIRYFDRGEEGQPNPECTYCHAPYVRNGWGHEYAGFYCAGCGETGELREQQYHCWKNGLPYEIKRTNVIGTKDETVAI